MNWMFVSFPKSYVEILPLNVVELEGDAFGRWLVHEGTAQRRRFSLLEA
jgi:hypothetical protein